MVGGFLSFGSLKDSLWFMHHDASIRIIPIPMDIMEITSILLPLESHHYLSGLNPSFRLGGSHNLYYGCRIGSTGVCLRDR